MKTQTAHQRDLSRIIFALGLDPDIDTEVAIAMAAVLVRSANTVETLTKLQDESNKVLKRAIGERDSARRLLGTAWRTLESISNPLVELSPERKVEIRECLAKHGHALESGED